MNIKDFFAPRRTLRITSPAMPLFRGEPALVATRLRGREMVNGLFEYELFLQPPESLHLDGYFTRNIDLDGFIGREISVKIELDGGETREINALIASASLSGEDGYQVRYRLTLRPWLYLAEQRVDCRVFQDQTVIQSLDQVLAAYAFPVDKRLEDRYPPHVYLTQYNESDFAFFERICQGHGISYFFEHEQGAHRLVLCSAMDGYRPNPGAHYRRIPFHAPGWKTELEYVERFEVRHQLVSGAYSTGDHDYTRPAADLSVSRVAPRPTAHSELAVYHWRDALAGSHFVQPEAPADRVSKNDYWEGPFTAYVRMELLRTDAVRTQGAGSLRGMVAGCTFEIFDHPNGAANQAYLILDAELLIEESAYSSQAPEATPGQRQPWRIEARFTAHPLGVPLRPSLSRPKPLCAGLQPALVVGAEGQGLWTDSYGRVKVQFPWDRVGGKNDRSSCWLRVSSNWAGSELGLLQIPRVGQEVLVGFEGGDVDLPVVVGSVANRANMPPWALPQQLALSGIRSRELARGLGNSAKGRSNHLVFDDTAAEMQVQLRSDQQSSSLALGCINRIEDSTGRAGPRGEGFELRTDGHGAIRAARGLLITTEARQGAREHVLDSGETLERLARARDLHEAGAELAVKNKAQGEGDQAVVAQILRKQVDSLQGKEPVGSGPGKFTELSGPDLVLASPGGIETTSQGSTHFSSAEHTAITSGEHTSVTSGGSLLMVAIKAMKLFAAEAGVDIVSARADIDLQALEACINLLAKKEIRLKAERISIEAGEELVLNGGKSFLRFTEGGIESGTTGSDVRHAAGHSMAGPSSRAVSMSEFGASSMRASAGGSRDLSFTYHDGEPVQGASFRITYADGQVYEGRFDKEGKADLTDAPVGNGRILLGEDTRAYVVKATQTVAPKRTWDVWDMEESMRKGRAGSRP